MLKLFSVFILLSLLLTVLAAACNPAPEIPATDNKITQPVAVAPSAGQTDNASITAGENATATGAPTRAPISKITKTDADLQRLVQGNPADIDNSIYPVTPVEMLHTTGNPRQVDISQYRLTVDGLVDHPLALSYEELQKFPSVTEVVLLICPDFFVDNAEWTGVPLTALLQTAGIQSKAKKVTIIGLDSYRQTLTREQVETGDVFLAYTVDGVQLPVEHGFPLRLVVKGSYGNIWVKWVQRIEVS